MDLVYFSFFLSFFNVLEKGGVAQGIILHFIFYCMCVNMYLYAHLIIIVQHYKED